MCNRDDNTYEIHYTICIQYVYDMYNILIKIYI